MSEEKQPMICKRCGRIELDKNLEVDEATMKEYFRCSLGGKPFTRSFNVADGDFTATFEVLSADAEVLLDKYINKDMTDIALMDLRLLLTLKEITKLDAETSGIKTIYSRDKKERIKVLDNPKASLEQLTSNFDSIMLGVLRRMNVTFMLLTNTILENIINQDFYEGVGLR